MARTGGRSVALVLTALLAGCGTTATAAEVRPGPAPSRAAPPRPQSPPAPKITFPEAGSGTFRAAAAQPSFSAAGGHVLRYRILVERDIAGTTPAAFAGVVQQTLDDPRGWSAEGTRQFRRVGRAEPADLTIYLVTPATRDTLCQDVPDGYTSCRNGDRVVLNVARWAGGVPHYGAPLAAYRQYMVNHEVGHRLGQGHERCRPWACTAAGRTGGRTWRANATRANPAPTTTPCRADEGDKSASRALVRHFVTRLSWADLEVRPAWP
jgi:hypothetical protein